MLSRALAVASTGFAFWLLATACGSFDGDTPSDSSDSGSDAPREAARVTCETASFVADPAAAKRDDSCVAGTGKTLDDDDANCGACGRVCPKCVAGRCSVDPVYDGKVEVPFAVAQGSLYYVDSALGEVRRIATGQLGVQPTKVEGVAFQGTPRQMTVRDGAIYVSTDRDQLVVPLPAGPVARNPALTALGTVDPGGVFVPGASASFYGTADPEGGRIHRVPAGGGQPVSKVRPGNILTLSVAEDIAFWTEQADAGVAVYGVFDNPLRAAEYDAGVGSISAADGRVYFAAPDVNRIVRWKPSTSGAVQPIVAESGAIAPLLVGGDFVYYAVQRDSGARWELRRISLCGGEPPLVLTDDITDAVLGLALDDQFLYAATASHVIRVPR